VFGEGFGAPSPAQLGLKLVQRLPKSLTSSFQVTILADTAFGSVDFLHGIRQLKYHAVTGIPLGRKLVSNSHFEKKSDKILLFK